LLAGCRTTGSPDDRANGVLRRYGDVHVVGFLEDADVAAVRAAVREVTDEVVLGVWPPHGSLQSFRRFETDVLPVDSAEVFTGEEADAAEALLLGRTTYERFAAAGPTSQGEGADQINALPKYVASTTLTQADLDGAGWNARLLIGDVPTAVRALKGEPGGALVVWGSARLAWTLAAHGLVDEYRLIVYPVLLGAGKRLFEVERTDLKLIEARPFASGATALAYRPAPAA
ncbi:MAG TPA: dihydrofolate reductase family protein, partial [Anaeromyxobacteraceae bacterium]|nr:dihydrofolate reductase family protein [Anaeromyxobacteraceae bacterium]